MAEQPTDALPRAAQPDGPENGRRLRVLCLDGGGVRGLSSLYILQRLMYRIQPGDDLQKLPKPCDVFDVIVGTSTGGLIAIMLGLLEMSVQSCIEAYIALAKDIFTPRARTKLGGAFLHKLLGSATFSAKKLEIGIKEIIRQNPPQPSASNAPARDSDGQDEATTDTVAPEDMMMLGSGKKCKVFVCAVMDNRRAYRIRSYQSKNEPALPMTVWQAARATSAAPTFFDPLKVGNLTTLRDGGLRNNNPVMEAMNEIESEFGATDSDIVCFVSIGTGISKTEFFRDDLKSVAEACAKIATETEETEATFRRVYAALGKPLHEHYFRFEVDQGLQEMGMEEWKKISQVFGVTTSYLNGGPRQEMMGKCAALLQAVTTAEGEEGESEPEPEPPSESPIRHHEFLGLRSSDAYLGRRPEMEWLDTVLSTRTTYHDLNTRPVIAAVTGLGGSGKTQLILRYAETHSADYGAVFWIDAKSEQTVRFSFNQIARILQIGSAARFASREGQESSPLIKAIEADDVYAFQLYIRNRRSPWLLLFDDLTDILLTRSISQFIPRESLAPGRVIITSRRRPTQPGWKCKELGGLDNTAARDLLFYYLNRKFPSAVEISQADRIVQELGCFPLSVCLAGSYIRVVGGLDRYLRYYDNVKRELLKKTLQGSANILEVYPESVFVAWKTTLAFLPESAKHLYFMFCTMDRNSISLDLLRRACSPKKHWDRDGGLKEVIPSDSGVPNWLWARCRPGTGTWDELALVEEIYQLESLFLVRRESYAGPWIYEGQVVKDFAAGEEAVVVKMEHYVQEIGTLMLDDDSLARYAAAAMCSAIHAIEDDVTDSMRMRKAKSRFEDGFIVLTPSGGMVNNASRLTLTLSECFGHLQCAGERFPGLIDHLKAKNLMAILDLKDFSAPVSCWFILSGMYLGGRQPAAACATLADLASAITFGSVALQNSTARHRHDEDTIAYWALSAMVCRVTEWSLWAKKCWVNGTCLAAKPVPDVLLNLFSIIRADNATFDISFPMITATVMEYYVACGQLESPLFSLRGGRLQDLPGVSMTQYLHLYWDIVGTRVAAILGVSNFPRNLPVQLDTSTGDFLGCSWLLDLPHLETRDLQPTVGTCGEENMSSYSPHIPASPPDSFLNKFRGSDLGEHVYWGMAIVASHWVKKPLDELLAITDTSGLLNRGRPT